MAQGGAQRGAGGHHHARLRVVRGPRSNRAPQALHRLRHHQAPRRLRLAAGAVEALIKDQPEVLALWREAITPRHGGDRVGGNAPSKSDNITLDGRGTSKSYTLDRLKRERPDLFRRVCDREMSAHRDAIEAGFRKQPTPFEQVAKLLPKLTAAERRKLKEMLGGSSPPCPSASAASSNPQQGARDDVRAW